MSGRSEPGQERGISSRPFPSPFVRIRKGGPSVRDTEIKVTVELRVAGREQPVWKRELDANASLIIRGEINEQSQGRV